MYFDPFLTSILGLKTNMDETAANIYVLQLISVTQIISGSVSYICKNEATWETLTGSNTLYAVAKTKTREVRRNFCLATYPCELKGLFFLWRRGESLESERGTAVWTDVSSNRPCSKNNNQKCPPCQPLVLVCKNHTLHQ